MPLDSTDLTWLSQLARALLRDPDAAEDLVQETVLAAVGGSPIPHARRRAWLGSVARRLAARRFRGEARRARRELRAARSESLPETVDLVARAEVAEQVTAAVRALPEPFRRTVLLRFLEEMSTEEIARREGKPTDTVRWRVRRGLELLRAELLRRHGGNWTTWCIALQPLARLGGSVGQPAAVATTGSTLVAVSWIAMKMKGLAWTVVAVVLGCGGAWWAWREPTPTQDPVEVAQEPEPDQNQSLPRVLQVPVDLEREQVETQGSVSGSSGSVQSGSDLSEWKGLVVDEQGEPIGGATVYLVVPGGGRRATVLSRTESDARGGFQLSWRRDSDSEVKPDLGVTANGYLRRVLPDVLARPDRTLRLVLPAGRRLLGRVEDREGRSVPNLQLVAHTVPAGIAHVSPSQTRLRSERANLADGTSAYYQCLGATDALGGVEFGGLPKGNLAVRSLDPGWSLVSPGVVRADGDFVVFRAERRLGVRVQVVEKGTGRPLERAHAVFHVVITFADGQVENYEQWVGRGRGEVSFLLDAEVLPPLKDRKVTRAVFYGTADSGGVEVQWRAKPLEDPRGVRGVATARVEISTDPVSEEAKALQNGTVELDVRYADGTPCTEPLWIEWRRDQNLSGEGAVESLAPGRYRATMGAGDLRFSVSERGASGSFKEWHGEVKCVAGRTVKSAVVLPRGGTVVLARPPGWQGEWYVRARFRDDSWGAWRGSWNYSTMKPTLILRAVRPADWRFELRKGSEKAPDPVLRTVTVVAGGRHRVQG